jgi:beta-xylosidase
MKRVIYIISCFLLILKGNAQDSYINPIIHADYSDPDAIRVGDDYYMIASSFNYSPGLPVLHSKDLVNWNLISYALPTQFPEEHFSKVQHGGGVWAPAIRYHNNEFYIYYPDPDFGIYLIKAKSVYGPWTKPKLIEAGKGLIDPCPLWDDDGNAYMVHAYAGSRAGIKSILVVKKLNTDGDEILDAGTIVYDGHGIDPTIEGPKFYKRNGYYYIFAPAGGVSTGWQTVLRSKNIYGPYERKVVMDQGSTVINGPHQGAWIDTKSGEDWFVHFQDKEAYGRIVHLQPMTWKNDWPVIGIDKDGDGKGEPVSKFRSPRTDKANTASGLTLTDEFDDKPGLQWQWPANPKPTWSLRNSINGSLRLYAQPIDSNVNYWNVPNLYTQKFPAQNFTATVKFGFNPLNQYDRAGLIVFGEDYASLSLQKKSDGVYLVFARCIKADKGNKEELNTIMKLEESTEVYVRVIVSKLARCSFSYSKDGKNFTRLTENFVAKPGRWVGARIGLFCTSKARSNDSGWADFDWVRIE